MHLSNITTDKATWIKRFARFGLISKGVVYTLSGLLALLAALHIGNSDEQQADRTGVFNFIYDQPMGQVLLAIIVVGLLCYATWRLLQGIKDTEDKGSDLKGLARRSTYIFSGLLYLSVAFYAAKLVLTDHKQNGDSKKALAQTLLEQPFGQALMAIAAAVMIGSGISQFYRAFSGAYKKHVQEHNNTRTANILVKMGKLGYVARGIVWLVVGWFFIKAAYDTSPSEAGDSGSIFHWVESGPYGSLLLAVLALGLICYGVFMFTRARYQHIHTS
jgi:uncharacterized membrane protein YidH (DUF202 family)